MKDGIKGLIVVLALVSILLAGCAGNPDDVAEPAAHAESAARIADFRLPDGYQPELTIEIAGYRVVSYKPGDEAHSHLYLGQAPANADITQEKLEELLRQAQIGKEDRTTRLTVVEKRTVSVRGQEVPLMVSEGINGNDEPYRQVMLAFQGNEGPALLVLVEPITHWDDARVDELIASIQ